MPRGYRSVILAAFGWLALSAQHPDSTTKPKEAQTDHRVGDAFTNIAATYRDQAKRSQSSPESEPCDTRKYDSNADLCAQWKAADAASDAAWWAWLSGMLSIIGLIGVSGALVLTFWSNIIARNAARHQLRAYPDFDGVRIELLPDRHKEGTYGVQLLICIKNYGQTPATKVVITTIYYLDERVEKMRFSKPDKKDFSVISPGDHVTVRARMDMPVRIWDRISDRSVTMLVDVKSTYTDAFGNERKLDSVFESDGTDADFGFVAGTRRMT